MKRKSEETLASMVSKKRAKGKAPRTSEAEVVPPAPAAPATQADLAEMYQKVTEMFLSHQTSQTVSVPAPAPPPPPPPRIPAPDISYMTFQRCNPPTFEGGPDPIMAEAWIRELEVLFKALKYPDEVKVDMVVPLLKKNAEFWWSTLQPAYEGEEEKLTWEEFKRVFYDQYFPEAVRLMKEDEFLALRQTEGMSVLEFTNKFNELGRFCSRLIDTDRAKAHRFEQGLRPVIRSRLTPLMLTSYKDMMERALRVEAELKKTESEREDRKKSKQVETSNPRKKNTTSNSDQKEASACTYCGRSHKGVCYKKTGACYGCGSLEHRILECPFRKKDSSGPPGSSEQGKKGNARVFALTPQNL